MVEVKEGSKTRIVSSCVYPIKDGLEVMTDSDKIRAIRKNIILLLLLKTPNNDYIKSLAEEYGVRAPERYMDSSLQENCILCGLCVKACEKLGTSSHIFVNRERARSFTPLMMPSRLHRLWCLCRCLPYQGNKDDR